MAATLMTMTDLHGHSPIASLFEWDFYLRDAMPAWYLLSSRVCLSVHLSQAGIVSRQLNLGS